MTPFLMGGRRSGPDADLSETLEIIAQDSGMSPADRDTLRGLAQTIADLKTDFSRSNSYAQCLREHNAAQEARLKERDARIVLLEAQLLECRQKLMPDRYGAVALAKVHSGAMPSWSLFPDYRTNFLRGDT